MAATSKADQVAREHQREVDDAQRERALLARVKAKGAYHPPIGADPEWEAIPVALMPLTAALPDEDAKLASPALAPVRDLFTAVYMAALKADGYNAAANQRANLGAANGYGSNEKPVRVAVLVKEGDITRKAIVVGTLAAIQQAFPDKATRKRWKAIGVTHIPSWRLVLGADGQGHGEWVPIDQAPKLLRMESVERAASV